MARVFLYDFMACPVVSLATSSLSAISCVRLQDSMRGQNGECTVKSISLGGIHSVRHAACLKIAVVYSTENGTLADGAAGSTVISFHCGKTADKEVKHAFKSNAINSQVTSSVSNILLNIFCNSLQIRLSFALRNKWH